MNAEKPFALSGNYMHIKLNRNLNRRRPQNIDSDNNWRCTFPLKVMDTMKMHLSVKAGLETSFYVGHSASEAAGPAVEERSLVSAPWTDPPGCCSLFALTRPNTGLHRGKQHHRGLAMSLSVSPLQPGTHRSLACLLCGAAVCTRPRERWHGFSIRWNGRVVYPNNKSPSLFRA